MVTRHEDVLAVLKDHRTFSSAGALKSSATPLPPEVRDVLADGVPGDAVHHRARSAAARPDPRARRARVHAAEDRELEPRIEAIASELLDELAPRGSADIVEAFAWPLPLRVLGELFGFPADDLEQVHHWGLDWLLLQQARPLAEQVAHAAGLVAFQRYCVAAVEDRMERPTDDLLGAMVAANEVAEEPLSAVEIAGLPLDLMVAGHVTVTRAIGSALDRAFAEPALRDHLLDPDLCARAIEEILRLESPAQGLFRVTTREVELGGAVLPAGRARDGALRLREPRRMRVRGR